MREAHFRHNNIHLCSALRRSPNGVWCVDQAPSAWSTHHTPLFLRGEAARAPDEREQVYVIFCVKPGKGKPYHYVHSRPTSSIPAESVPDLSRGRPLRTQPGGLCGQAPL